jgi:C4-dicarboxylate-specific signal transduction histidine kinase
LIQALRQNDSPIRTHFAQVRLISRDIRQPGQDLLDTMSALGSHIGQFIERKRAENALQLAQAELAHMSRVMAMGELTSSIAHEINQPLTGLLTKGDACLRYLDEGRNLEGARRAIKRMMRDAMRASEVITRIRANRSRAMIV